MLVLASQSPRRKELLTAAGIPHLVRVSGVPEVPEFGEKPESYVVRLAESKARAIAIKPEEFILAADTVVLVEGCMLEKPSSHDEAERMLKLLSGRWHQVLTGICVLHRGKPATSIETTAVHFVELSDREILDYIATGEPFDKAGGYAIQGRASRYIDRIEGCYFNVVGLPIHLVYRTLVDCGYPFFPFA